MWGPPMALPLRPGDEDGVMLGLVALEVAKPLRR
jgi:hypothetical protein